MHVSSPLLRTLLVLLGASLLFAAAGCSADAPDEPAFVLEEPEGEVLYFEHIGMGNYATLSDTTRVLIREPEVWARYRTQLRTAVPFREVDFEQAMVILVAIPTPSGGYSVAIESVDKVGGEIVVSYVLTRPGDDCLTVLARSVPFQAVLARRAEGTARFEQREESLNCELP